MSYIVRIVALLCFASCVAGIAETEHEFKDLQLQQDSLSWLDKLQNTQELTKKDSLVDLLYELSKSEKGLIPQGPADAQKQEKNRRGLDGMTTQTRRAGCRVFFWKSWTAC